MNVPRMPRIAKIESRKITRRTARTGSYLKTSLGSGTGIWRYLHEIMKRMARNVVAVVALMNMSR